MSKFSSRNVKGMFKQAGFELKEGKGDHCKCKHPSTGNLIAIPDKRKEIKHGTLRSIFNQAGVPHLAKEIGKGANPEDIRNRFVYAFANPNSRRVKAALHVAPGQAVTA